MLVIEADSLEAAMAVIESDVYYQTGVVSVDRACTNLLTQVLYWQWDKEKLQIYPWLQANF